MNYMLVYIPLLKEVCVVEGQGGVNSVNKAKESQTLDEVKKFRTA